MSSAPIVMTYPSQPAQTMVPTTPAKGKSGNLADVKVQTAGLILLDKSLKPVYANSEAIQALAYPENPKNWTVLSNSLFSRIRALFGQVSRTNNSMIPSAELISGKRRYICRNFVLDAESGQSAKPNVAILIERPITRTTDFEELAARFRLTQRERRAVEFLAKGLTGKEIAAEMNISPNTVKTFMRLVMIKMGVTTRSGIVGKIMIR